MESHCERDDSAVDFDFRADGTGDFSFWLDDEKCQMSLERLCPMASALGASLERYVTPLNCVYAVGPLLRAMANAGWLVSPPKRSIPSTSAKSISAHT